MKITHHIQAQAGRFLFALLITLSVHGLTMAQGVGIGTTTPHPSAALDISSDDSGVLIPRMTAAQRDAILSPETGLMVFVSDDSRFYCYDGTQWTLLRAIATELVDDDGDTKVLVQQGMDNDTIRLITNGVESFRIANGRMEVFNDENSVFIGAGTGPNTATNNNSSVFIGDSSGVNITFGGANVGIGYRSLYANTSNDYNTAVGFRALMENNEEGNTAVGAQVLEKNTTGFNNTATGAFALRRNTTGDQNTATGAYALEDNSIGQRNTASGYNALTNNTTGDHNTATGYSTMFSNTSGANNTAFGYQSGYSTIDTGSVFLGYKAGYFETGGDRLYIENSDAGADSALIYGEFDNDLLRINGNLVPRDGISDDDGDTRIVLQEGMDDDTIRFIMNGAEKFRMGNGRLEVFNFNESVYIGAGAGVNDDGTDKRNVMIGDSAGVSTNGTATDNTGIGYRALYSNTFGDANTANGAWALYSSTTGYENTANGYMALYSNTDGDNNTANGYLALYANTSGEFNTASGWRALTDNTTGTRNLGLGAGALQLNTEGSYNVGIGNGTLFNNTVGAENTALGFQAGYNTIDTGSVFLGYKAGYFETAGNRLYIENSDGIADSALIYGEFDNNRLAFNAQVGIGTIAPAHDLHVIGNALIRDTLRSALTLQVDENAKDIGLAFRREGQNFEWNIFRQGGTANLVIANGNDSDITNLTPRMIFASNGAVGIGTSSPTALLSVNGQANKPGGGAWGVFSDLRLKDIHGKFGYGLDAILRLEPIVYNYKDDNALDLPSGRSYAGFVAQEVQKVIPEAVDDSGEYLTIQADPIYLAMLNAIKELKAENDALKAEMATRLDTMQAQLEALSARLTADQKE